MVVRHPTPGAPHLLAQHVERLDHQRRRRRPRAPDPGPARPAHHPPRQGAHRGPDRGPARRHRHSRVARSNIWGLTKLGATRHPLRAAHARPQGDGAPRLRGRLPPRRDPARAATSSTCCGSSSSGSSGACSRRSPSIPSFYMMTQERVEKAKPDLLLLAPGPINRGVELTPEVADGTHSAILDQVTNGLAVRMAVLLPRRADRRQDPEHRCARHGRPGRSQVGTTRLTDRGHSWANSPCRPSRSPGAGSSTRARDLDEIGDLWISRGQILPSGAGYEEAEIVIDARG